MDSRPRQPVARRFGLLVLILLGLGLLGVVVYVMATDTATSALDTEVVVEEPELDTARPPNFVFPTTARSYDPLLNAFIDRFASACLSGKYSEFRLMYTRKLEPPAEKAFVTMFNAVKEIRVIRLDKLPPLKAFPGQAYRLVAECELHDFAVRNGKKSRRIQVAVLFENGQWVMAPLPRGSSEQLDALLAGTTRPADEDSDLE
jgi:hypothetical protein